MISLQASPSTSGAASIPSFRSTTSTRRSRFNLVVRSSSTAGEEEAETSLAQLSPLAAVFRRRLLTGAGTAGAVAVGANFGGFTSFLLGLVPELGRRLKLDLLYPVQGFSRCLEADQGFEFIYPANWVGDQTLLYRAASRAESERSLDPPPLSRWGSSKARPRSLSEPIVAFGPPGTKGDLNVSVIVAPVPPDFSIEAFGGPKEVGEAVLRRVAKSRRGPDVRASLLESSMRSDPLRKVNYYKLEFGVKGPTFRRHNMAVCAAKSGKLYTLNAQAPESTWPAVREEFNKIADSFNLTYN